MGVHIGECIATSLTGFLIEMPHEITALIGERVPPLVRRNRVSDISVAVTYTKLSRYPAP